MMWDFASDRAVGMMRRIFIVGAVCALLIGVFLYLTALSRAIGVYIVVGAVLMAGTAWILGHVGATGRRIIVITWIVMLAVIAILGAAAELFIILFVQDVSV